MITCVGKGLNVFKAVQRAITACIVVATETRGKRQETSNCNKMQQKVKQLPIQLQQQYKQSRSQSQIMQTQLHNDGIPSEEALKLPAAGVADS